MNVVRHSPLFNAHDLPAQLFSYSLSTLDALVPVQLPPEDFDKFKAAFHARKRRKQDAPGKKFSDLAVYLSHVSAYVNAILDGLRASYRMIPHWQSAGEDVGRAISVRIAEQYNPSGNDKGLEAFAATLDDKALSFLGSMCTGRHHIVVDSARYPGGKDILYVGTRGADQSSTLCVNKSKDTELPEFTNQFAYGQLQSNGHLDNKVNQAVVELARNLLDYFTGSQLGYQDVYLRSLKQISITAHIFDQIVKIVNKSKLVKMGVVLTLPKFSAELAPASAAKLVDYTSILALYEPSANIVAARVKHTGSDETFPVSLDTAALQATICFSFAVNLPDNFVRYIAQAQPNEKPSLASVNTWSTAWSASMLRPKGMRGGIPPAKAPMYVIPPSKAPEISKRRAALGLFTEPGRINEDGLYVNARGDLNWLPPASEANLANAQAYEKQLELALQLSFDAGTPLAASQVGSTDKLFDLTHPEYGAQIRKVKEELAKYQGSVQSYSWDLNSVISVSATDPGRVVSSKLTGATRPTELNMATYMRGPFPEMMASMFSRSRQTASGDTKTVDEKSFTIHDATEIEKLSVFLNFASFYRKAVEMKLVPSLPDLISQAAQAFKIKDLSDDVVKDFEISRLNKATTIYKNVLSPDLKLLDAYSEPEMCGAALIKLLEAAIADASCNHTSNLAAYCLTNKEEPEEDPHFFRADKSTLAEFSNVYNYFGGRVAYLAMKAVASIKSADLQTRYPHKTDEPVVSFTAIMTEVVPFAHMMSNYIVDRRDEIYAKADEIIDTNSNPKKSEDELRIPGSRAPTKSKPGMQLFPHQAEALRLLANHPRIAILDIAPGGGKCLAGRHTVHTSKGLLSLEELWNSADPSTERDSEDGIGKFRDLVVEVQAHTGKVCETSHVFTRVGTTVTAVFSNGLFVEGLPEHRVYVFDDRTGKPDFVRLDELNGHHWAESYTGFTRPGPLDENLATWAAHEFEKNVEEVPIEIRQASSRTMRRYVEQVLWFAHVSLSDCVLSLHTKPLELSFIEQFCTILSSLGLDVTQSIDDCFKSRFDIKVPTEQLAWVKSRVLQGGGDEVVDVLEQLYGRSKPSAVQFVERIVGRTTQVFDLSVPGPHSYAFSGICGHNTIIGLSDMAMLMHDNLVKGPFYVICPNGLVKNWVEDMHKVTEGKWNVIPITTETYNSWGDEKLTEMIQKAPRNTVVVVGNSFLSSTGKSQLVIGNAVERVSNSIEFIKKFRPEYIIIDESHRIRNTESSLHHAVKTINTMSSVKYGRIATGTLIQNVMSDVVGQSAIYSAQIFRSKEDFDKTNKSYVAGPDGQPQLDYSPDVPKKARERLSEFATVISFKRKEWAFMLPQPIETFIRVKMEDEKLDGEDKMGHAHRMLYDAVLTRTMEELRQDKLIKKLTSGKGDDDNNDDDDDDDDKPAGKKVAGETAMAGGKKIDVSSTDDDGDNLDALEAALQPYLQRLERLLTDPLGDPDLAEVAEKFFGDLKRSDVVTAKVRKIVERIKFHFTKIPWKKGNKYRSSDMCDHNGETYILRADEPVGKSEYVSIKSPDEDPDNWKLQSRGKVLVFCRYTRSVEAIYRALPAEFKKRAVVFHGEVEGDKWENLDKFKEDPSIDILIANEMGISEGHNLQMASRFIRAEAPWAPGELDQSAARIFRPDVEGKFKRQTIFLDWIVTDGSLEVAKMGRLISKMLKKTQFDELYNPKYYKGLNPRNLPVIRMTLENIENLNSLSDLCSMGGEGHMGDIHPDSYIGQYQFLVSEQASEFREMRKTKRAYMLDVEPTPMPDDAKIIEYTPWVANMKVPDRNNDGLVSLNGILREEDNPLTKAIAEDKDAIVGKYVRTEFGVGKVKGYTSTRGKSDAGEDGEEEGANGYSKIRVALAQGGIVLVGASKVFIANNVTDRSAKGAIKGAPKFAEKDKRQTKRNEDEVEAAADRESKRATRIRKAVEGDARRSRDNEAEPAEQPQEEIVELHAAVYNRFLALEAITPDEGDTYLKTFGFTKFGSYAYIPVKNEDQYNDILDWLEDKFTLAPKTEKYLESMLESFNTGRGRKFNIELAPVAEIPHFLQTRHRLTKVANSRKPDLKVYPLIVHAAFFLAVDLASNPVFRKFVGKTVPHASPAAKINEADGMDVMFFKTKGELIRKVKEIRDSGISITNYEEVKVEIKDLNVKVAAV